MSAEHCRAWRAKHRLEANAMSLDWYRRNRERILEEKRAKYQPRVRQKLREDQRRPKVIRYLLSGPQQRAKRRALAYDLDTKWLRAKWTGYCAVPLVPGRRRKGPSPFSPSIDRIDPLIGYTQANCRIVAWAYNALKGCGTDADALVVARALVAQE